MQTSICHVLLKAVSKAGYVSPLLLSVGIFIHQTTCSRALLDVLSSLGLSASYHQVMVFERSAATTRSEDGLAPGLLCNDGSVNFRQWVADNFDFNKDTLTGENTTYTIISYISPKFDFGSYLRQVTAADVLKMAE